MFVVTSDGVIATDPIGYGRPQAVATYIDEIKKVTQKPIKYLIYSHHHYDHIAGGKAFKDAGAKIVAHKKAKERLALLKDPATPLPDETMDKNKTIRLGGTTLELTYIGLNHSDSTIVMRLPKEKILFAVDFLPVGSVPGRGMIARGGGFDQAGAEDGLGAADPRPPGAGRPAGHQAGRPGPAHLPAGRLRRREGRGARGQVLGAGGKGSEAAEVREMARLREQPAVRDPALLRTVG